MGLTGKFWIKIAILAAISSILVLLSLLNPGKTGDKTLKNKFPDIDYPIGCNGVSEEEYSKRKEHSAGFFEPEIYTDSNQNKWNNNIGEQKFNILDRGKNGNWVQKYPDNKTKIGLKAFNFPSESLMRNFIEEVNVRPNEIDVHGNGYFFTDKGPVLTLNSKYLFTEIGARSKDECFDDKRRILNINAEGNSYYGSSRDISGDLNFSILTPQYCSLYSFLETKGDLFLVCLSEKVTPEKTKFLILGYSEGQTESPEDPAVKLTSLIPVLNEEVVENYKFDSFFYFRSNYMTMMQNAKGYYYVIAGTQVFEIKPDESNHLTMRSLETENSGQWLNVIYPNKYLTLFYDLPYVFIAFPGASDKPGLLFNINKGEFLKIDYDSCVIKSPENFYNSTVDPFLAGPYKTMSYEAISPKHIKVNQSSSNSGCTTEEGIIDVYIENDSVRCDVEVTGRLLGC